MSTSTGPLLSRSAPVAHRVSEINIRRTLAIQSEASNIFSASISCEYCPLFDIRRQLSDCKDDDLLMICMKDLVLDARGEQIISSADYLIRNRHVSVLRHNFLEDAVAS